MSELDPLLELGFHQKPEDALVEIEKVLEINPENEKALFLKSTLLYSLGKKNEGMKEIEKVLKIKSEDILFTLRMADVLFMIGNFEQAIEGLTGIVDNVEAGDISVESSLNQYEKGMAIIKHCRGILQDAETKIKKISD